MQKRSLALLMAVAVAAVTLISLTIAISPGDGPVARSYEVTLSVSEGGSYTQYSAEGGNLREILEDALGEEVVIQSNGNVASYKGIESSKDTAWVVFIWDGTGNWSANVAGKLHDGAELVLQLSARIAIDNSYAYEAPTLEITKEVYFFIQIPSMAEIESVATAESSRPDSNNRDLTVKERFTILLDWLERAGLDYESVEHGLWIKGRGSNVNEALVDAVRSSLYPGSEMMVLEERGVLEYYLAGDLVHSHLTIQQMYGWFVTFLGWTDTSLANGDWTYWSQFAYNPNARTMDDARQWTYNTMSLGMHDLTRYHYFALVLQTTSERDSEQGIWMALPTPSEIGEELL